MPQDQHVGEKRVGSFPAFRNKKPVTLYGVLEVQKDLGERLVSPAFATYNEAVKWWAKNPQASGS